MKILFLGDIVSKVGRRAVAQRLPKLKEEKEIDLIFANAENLAGGRGVTPDTVDEMLQAGVDYFTSGNHVFYTDCWKEVLEDESFRMLRPLNYPDEVSGRGFTEIKCQVLGVKCQVLLVNLISNSIDETAENPFHAIDDFLSNYQPLTSNTQPLIIIDFHSERSSTKRAMGFYLDGRVFAVFGTHTHVPTADAQILPEGSAYVSDVGMVGPQNSVLGVEKEIIIDRHCLPQPQRFEWVKSGRAQWNSVLVTFDTKGKTSGIERLDFTNLDREGNA